MAGMYPDNETISIFGQNVKYPGVDASGKFTDGDFADPLVPPSRLPAKTLNLIIDNLGALISKLGGTPDNTGLEQLAALFTSAAAANRGIMRDADGRAQVAAPSAAADIARKAEVNAEAEARVQADTQLQAYIDSEADTRAAAVEGVNTNLNTHADNITNPHGVTKAQVGLGNCNNTADIDKSVKYAISARDAGTVGGYSAGDAEGMLIPVVACRFGSSAAYIKLKNGWIVQAGKASSSTDNFFVKYPVDFESCCYPVAEKISDGVTDKNGDRIRSNSLSGFTYMYNGMITWVAIGV